MLLWVLCGLVACSKPEAQERKWPDQQTLIKFAEKHVGKAEYKRIRKMAADSVAYWGKNRLKSWVVDTTTIQFKFDTIVCINSNADKLFMAHLGRQLTPIGKLDAIGYLYGVKIEKRWYFLGGPTQFIYRKDLKRPTSFSTLHEYAVQHIFRAYIKADSTGKWQINERFFGDLTSRAACPYGYTCQTPEEWDKAYLYWVVDNWKYRLPAKSESNRESSLSIEPPSAGKPK